MGKTPHVAIILVNYHGLDDTVACITSLQKLPRKTVAYDILVVDESDSGDGDRNALQKAFPGVEIVSSPNIGFSGANNLGIAEALKRWDSSYILMVNNDTTVDSQLLANLLRAAGRNGKLALYSPKIYFEPGREFHRTAYTDKERGLVLWYAGGLLDWKNVYGWHRGVNEVDHGQFDTEEQTQFSTGCCMLIPRETLKRIGALDNAYFLYLEDADYSMRVRKHGGECWYVPSAVMWHKNAGSSGGSGSDTHQYYQTRNRLLFGMRYAPLRAKVALVKEALKMALRGNAVQREAVKDVMLSAYGKRGKT